MQRLFVLAFVCVAAATLTPTASAAVAGQSSLDGETIVYSADPGEANRLTVGREGDRLVFDDPGATIAAGRGCVSVSATRVTCEPSRGFTSVELGDGDDEATTSGDVGGVGGTIGLNGEQGNDVLRGTADSNSLSGGPGADRLEAGPGTNSLYAVFTLGDGSPLEMPELVLARDTITCVPPAESVDFRSVSVDETDVVSGDCGTAVHVYTEDAVVGRGSEGADLISGNYFPTRLYGLGGNDRLFGTGTIENRMDGGPGDDSIESGGLLLGGDGDDRLSSAIANESPVRQDGGPGADVLLGRYGNDRLVGGTGRDRISGGSGNDYVNARDRERDSVRCGDGRSDRVVADRGDSVARDCERVSRR